MNIEKIQQKIVRSDMYALKNVEILSIDEMSLPKTARLHVKALGNSMVGAGIFANDLLIIDRSLEAEDGHVVLALVYGQFTLKRLQLTNGKIFLLPENNEYKSFAITSDCDFKVVGVLIFNIHKHI
ncbi:MAG: hypothetical protein H7256_10630 [Bdellovibrio sp.]|nr:hypothetical protein [Bdellovibrio sp.]